MNRSTRVQLIGVMVFGMYVDNWYFVQIVDKEMNGTRVVDKSKSQEI